MSVLTFIAAIGAHPEPAIQALLKSFEKKLAHNVGFGARGLSRMLLRDHALQFGLIPIFHSIYLQKMCEDFRFFQKYIYIYIYMKQSL